MGNVGQNSIKIISELRTPDRERLKRILPISQGSLEPVCNISKKGVSESSMAIANVSVKLEEELNKKLEIYATENYLDKSKAIRKILSEFLGHKKKELPKKK